MTQASGSGDVTLQWLDGSYYRIPVDRLSEFKLSDTDVQAMQQEIAEVSGGDVRGFSSMMPMRMMPMNMASTGNMMERAGSPVRMVMPMYMRGVDMSTMRGGMAR